MVASKCHKRNFSISSPDLAKSPSRDEIEAASIQDISWLSLVKFKELAEADKFFTVKKWWSKFRLGYFPILLNWYEI
jgi:hypothetical protein